MERSGMREPPRDGAAAPGLRFVHPGYDYRRLN
jgi:hypothetical protein